MVFYSTTLKLKWGNVNNCVDLFAKLTIRRQLGRESINVNVTSGYRIGDAKMKGCRHARIRKFQVIAGTVDDARGACVFPGNEEVKWGEIRQELCARTHCWRPAYLIAGITAVYCYVFPWNAGQPATWTRTRVLADKQLRVCVMLIAGFSNTSPSRYIFAL